MSDRLKSSTPAGATGPKREGKVIITGTGRSGTTFLIQLFTLLGLDTGFDETFQVRNEKLLQRLKNKKIITGFQPDVAAGCEVHLLPGLSREYLGWLPRFIKDPRLCNNAGDESLARILDEGNLEVDHVIVPIRSLVQAAESRIRNQLHLRGQPPLYAFEPPDLVFVTHSLARSLGGLFETLVLRDIPFTTLAFPRLVSDPVYAFDRLRFFLGECTEQEFEIAHRKLSTQNPRDAHERG